MGRAAAFADGAAIEADQAEADQVVVQVATGADAKRCAQALGRDAARRRG